MFQKSLLVQNFTLLYILRNKNIQTLRNAHFKFQSLLTNEIEIRLCLRYELERYFFKLRILNEKVMYTIECIWKYIIISWYLVRIVGMFKNA